MAHPSSEGWSHDAYRPNVTEPEAGSLHPLNIGVEKQRFFQLPPTPMTAYFDAEDNGDYDEFLVENIDLHTDKDPSATSPVENSPSSSCEDDVACSGSAGTRSFSSSNGDTPGPVTPATPGWKPKELKLLQSRVTPPIASDSRRERRKTVEGLGIRGLSSDRQSARNGKDIIPIETPTLSSNIQSPSSSLAPRELKLSASTGPPSLRNGQWTRNSPSSMSAPIVGRLPVRHGPAFSAGTMLEQATFPSMTGSPAEANAKDFRSTHFQVSNTDANIDRVSEQGPESALISHTSFTESSGTHGTRKKGPPTPLILVPSPPSSYSHGSGEPSQPSSAHIQSNAGGDTFEPPNAVSDTVQDTLISDNVTTNTSTHGTSLNTPSVFESFRTPLQSPMPLPSDEQQPISNVQKKDREEADSKYALTRAPSDSKEAGINSSDPDLVELKHCPGPDTDSSAHDLQSTASTYDNFSGESVAPFEYENDNSPAIEKIDTMADQIRETERKTRKGTDTLSPTEHNTYDQYEPDILRGAPPSPRMHFNTSIFSAPGVRTNQTIDPSGRYGGDNFGLPGLHAEAPMSPREQHYFSPNVADQSTSFQPMSNITDSDKAGIRASLRNGIGYQPLDVQPQMNRRVMQVPDVPSFGYLAASTTASPAFSVSPVELSRAPSPKEDAFLDDSPCVSKWSSGSEDESERVVSKPSSRKGSKSRKQSTNVEKSMRKNSSANNSVSGNAPLKKGSLFSGLGLRKKSVPNLQMLADNSLASSPQPLTSSSATDSPGGKLDMLNEFPFPPQAHQTVSSRTSSSGLQSEARSHGRSESLARALPRMLQQQVTQQSLTERMTNVGTNFSQMLNTRRSDASLSSAMVHASTPSLDSSYIHPRTLPSNPPAALLQGLGIQVSEIPENKTCENSNSPNLRSHRSSESLRSSASISRATETVRASKTRDSHLRKRSTSTTSPLREKHSSEDSACDSSLGSPNSATPPVPSVPSQHNSRIYVASPDDTPRAGYTPLIPSHPEGTSSREDDSEGLFALGQALVRGPQPYARRETPRKRPRYPSLTEAGMRWLETHPSEPFDGARGSALFAVACAASSHNSSNSHTFSNQSESTTDDYGSSEGSANNSSMPCNGGRGSSGGRERRDREDHSFSASEISLAESDSDSGESTDSYGASENDLSSLEAKNSRIRQRSNLATTAASGISHSDPRQRDSQRPKDASLNGKSRTKEVTAQQCTQGLDINELDSRLYNLQLSQKRQSSLSRESKTPVESLTQKHIVRDYNAKSPLIGERRIGRKAAPRLRMNQKAHDDTQAASPLADSGGDARNPQNTNPTGSKPDVVADFANTVRARSRSRVGLRPAAIDVSKANPMPALPREFSASQDKGGQTAGVETVTQYAVAIDTPNVQSQREAERQQMELDTIEQQVFLCPIQKFISVKVSTAATARDFVHLVLRNATLPSDGKIGGWAIFDVSTEIGLERPIRENEILTEIIASRHNLQKDTFVIRRTDLAPYLSIQALPSACPALAGWVYMQDNSKKRAWTKRWLEMRNHALYHYKSEKGRDEAFLCQLSTFDVCVPSDGMTQEDWTARAPKKNCFAVRSINAVHLFESPQTDYAFFFCLSDEKASRHWITSIIRARSFILRQEKTHLFPSVSLPATNKAVLTAPSRPLVTFPNERFMNGYPLDRDISPLRSAPAGSHHSRSLVDGQSPTPDSKSVRNRHDEVIHAERLGRKQGVPLIGVAQDMNHYQRGIDGPDPQSIRDTGRF